MILHKRKSDYLDVHRGKQVMFVASWFFIRRIIFVIPVILMPKFRSLHLLIYCLSCIIKIISLNYVHPFEPSRNNLEIFNEICIMLMFYHLHCYNDFVPDPILRYKIGYSQLFFFGIFLLVHIYTLLKETYKNLVSYYKEKKRQKIINKI